MMLASGCQAPQPTPVSHVTPASESLSVTGVREATENKIALEAQVKTFDQCESASPFETTIRFSRSDSGEAQRELVLGAEVGGSYGLSAVAEAEVKAAIENHYRETVGSIRGHEEEAKINVPAHTKQEYTIIWKEVRRSGTVEYDHAGQTNAAAYNYVIGIELESTEVRDLPCPTRPAESLQFNSRQTVEPTHTPTSAPTSTPTPPHTQEPTNTPEPTATIGATATPQNTDLEVNQYFTRGSIALALTQVRFRSNFAGPYVVLAFTARNVSNQPISFQYGGFNFRVKDNLGNAYAIATSLASPVYNITLEPGDSRSIRSGTGTTDWSFFGNYTNPQVEYLTVTISDFSAIEHAEWKIPINH
jgi:hypothetical protein